MENPNLCSSFITLKELEELHAAQNSTGPVEGIIFHVVGPLPPLPPHSHFLKSASFIHPLSSDSASQLPSGKRCHYRRFLPAAFAAVPGMAAVFTQARSGKLWIPHPHDMCITGHQGQGVPGRKYHSNPGRKKKIQNSEESWRDGPDQSQGSDQPGQPFPA